MNLNQQQKVHYILRIAVAMCFIGHGVFGIITKAVWCNYFAVFGIGEQLAYRLMPFVGVIDIVLGLIMLIFPIRAIPAWLVIWGITTALLRPLSGEPFAEFIERAGNFGAPLALLLLSGFPKTLNGWFTRIDPAQKATETDVKWSALCLRVITFLLLFGHGWLNLIEKKGLLAQYGSLGISNPVSIAHVIGIAEMIGAFMILVKPFRPLLLLFFIWKISSEVLYPKYGILEWIERGGSYGSLLALWVTAYRPSLLKISFKKNKEFSLT